MRREDWDERYAAVENLWAAKLVEALQAADAVVIDSIRIPVDVVTAALETS